MEQLIQNTLASDRKRRLFACACCRQLDELLPPAAWDAILHAEQFADGSRDAFPIAAASFRIHDYVQHAHLWGEANPSVDQAAFAASGTFHANTVEGVIQVVEAVRIAVEDLEPPFLPPAFRMPTRRGRPHATRTLRENKTVMLHRRLWHHITRPTCEPINRGFSRDAQKLAERIYYHEEASGPLRDFLLEAGEDGIAEHFKDPAVWHPKGCWALDVILGRS